MQKPKQQPAPFVFRVLSGAIAWLVGGVLAVSILAAPAWAVSYNNRALTDSDFSGQDLREASFDHANLRGSNFRGANLQGVRFFSANLSETNFEGADLTAADLESARLTGANFTNAVLVGAFATNTKWEGATIEGADLTDILLRPDTERILCQMARGTNPVTGRHTRDTLNCD